MPSIKYWQNLGKIMVTKNRIFLNNEGLVIHVLCHWKLLYVIYSLDIQKVSIIYTNTLMSDNHLGNRYSWWRNIVFNGKTMNDMGKISQVLNNPHGRCVVGAFEKIYMKSLFGLDTHLCYILS